MKTALIIGSAGQDGILLQYLLKEKGYRVLGLSRQASGNSFDSGDHLSFDLSRNNFEPAASFIKAKRPDEIYYVAAFNQSSEVSGKAIYADPEQFVNVNQLGFIRVLEICRVHLPNTRIVYTGSSLIYAGSHTRIQNEETAPAPQCMYSLTKNAAMEAARFYRTAYGLFVSTGIMYNHESMYRGDQFLSKRIINQTRKLVNKEISSITVGSLSAETDWGYAPDYVAALWHMLQLTTPDTFIVSSGKSHTVRNWFEVLFGYLQMNWEESVTEDISLVQRAKPVLIGDHSKLVATGWNPKVSFEEMVLRIYRNIL